MTKIKTALREWPGVHVSTTTSPIVSSIKMGLTEAEVADLAAHLKAKGFVSVEDVEQAMGPWLHSNDRATKNVAFDIRDEIRWQIKEVPA